MTETCETSIDELLGEPIETCRARESSAFDRAAGGAKGVVVFGAGGLGRKVLGILRELGTEPLSFADNKLAGKVVLGVPVLSPEEAVAKYGGAACFIVAMWATWNDTGARIQWLKRSGCKTVVPFNSLLWKRPGLLPHVQVELPSRLLKHRERILQCGSLWADERSRQEFAAQLRWRLHADYDALTPPVSPAYWQRSIVPLDEKAVYVDGGAFDGDTVEQFVTLMEGQFKRIYAFEPDAENFTRLTERVNRMPRRENIECINSGLAERKQMVPFQCGLGSSSAFGGDGMASCVTLDESLREPATFIKMDIEGFEMQALAGAEATIREHAPALAICVYHTPDHLWDIPLLIHSMNPGYRFYLRPHAEVWETVCYAVMPRP